MRGAGLRLAHGTPATFARRALYKRALDLPAADLPKGIQPWLTSDPDLLERVEDAAATAVGLEAGELLIDYPERSNMLSVNLPLRTRDGAVERLTEAGRAGRLGLPRVADELYRSARRLRIFVARPPQRPVEQLLEWGLMTEVEVRATLGG